MRQKLEKLKKTTQKYNMVHVYKCPANVGGTPAVQPTCPLLLCLEPFFKLTQTTFISNTKQPVSANRVEVLASPANEC